MSDSEEEKVSKLEFQITKLKAILYELKTNFESYQLATERKILEMENRFGNEIQELHYQLNN
tara:strand:+ start:133 stop:318 length:186 start_codon:yes stop_codon:yes gene_type:complete